ncbi:hypothetical protein ACFLT9_06400 [Acidobacteriota bacterium]
MIREFFNQLNEGGIRYCHWKSNGHLRDGIEGKTDLDILVDTQHEEEFGKVLNQHHFKPMIPPTEKASPFMCDYLGFDPASGRLLHLHVHTGIIIGSKYLKNYILPIAETFLGSTTVDPETSVKIPEPKLELMVLTLRIILKYQIKQILKAQTQAKNIIPTHIAEEIGFLKDQIESFGDGALIETGVLQESHQVIQEFHNRQGENRLSHWRMIRLQFRLKKIISKYRQLRGLRFVRTYSRNRLKNIWALRTDHYKKTMLGGGRTIAFIGVDGSGKSTVRTEIGKWLGWKLKVKYYYLGKQRKRTPSMFVISLFLSINRRIYSVLKFLTLLKKAGDLLTALQYVFAAKHKLTLYQNSLRDKQSGSIVLFDRYPLDAFKTFFDPMDGPKISSYMKNNMGRFMKWCAKREAAYHRQIKPPDHLVLLEADRETVLRRKPENLTNEETIKNKIRMVESLSETEYPVVRIDASLTLREVLRQIKKHLWEWL